MKAPLKNQSIFTPSTHLPRVPTERPQPLAVVTIFSLCIFCQHGQHWQSSGRGLGPAGGKLLKTDVLVTWWDSEPCPDFLEVTRTKLSNVQKLHCVVRPSTADFSKAWSGTVEFTRILEVPSFLGTKDRRPSPPPAPAPPPTRVLFLIWGTRHSRVKVDAISSLFRRWSVVNIVSLVENHRTLKQTEPNWMIGWILDYIDELGLNSTIDCFDMI